MSPAVAPSAFQAINDRAVSENAGIEVPATNQKSGSMTPTHEPVTNVAPQPAQTSAPASSSQPAVKMSTEGDASDTAMDATYGTRSRNRTNARPNYAEDQEMDFEMSTSAASKKKAAADASTSGTPDSRNDPVTSSSAANASNSSSKAPAGGAKDPAPATSRKRKAAGAPASNLHTPVSSTPPPSGARKAAASAVLPPLSSSFTMARESNIMTFAKSRSSLNKKGELVADDGQKLCVNGKHLQYAAILHQHANPTNTLTHQITSILFASLLVIRTISVGSWSFCTSRATIPTHRWMRSV
jgi:hypothetical protein